MSLKLIWSALNTLQLIVYLEKIHANLPAQSQIVLLELKRIALFEFMPYKWMTGPLTKLFAKDENMADYEDDSVFDKMGTMLVIGVVLFIFIGIIVLLVRFCS